MYIIILDYIKKQTSCITDTYIIIAFIIYILCYCAQSICANLTPLA
jgi:hypothetical protein